LYSRLALTPIHPPSRCFSLLSFNSPSPTFPSLSFSFSFPHTSSIIPIIHYHRQHLHLHYHPKSLSPHPLPTSPHPSPATAGARRPRCPLAASPPAILFPLFPLSFSRPSLSLSKSLFLSPQFPFSLLNCISEFPDFTVYSVIFRRVLFPILASTSPYCSEYLSPYYLCDSLLRRVNIIFVEMCVTVVVVALYLYQCYGQWMYLSF